jgi:hypothetical protein
MIEYFNNLCLSFIHTFLTDFWSPPSGTEDTHLAHCIYLSFHRLIWALHDLCRVVWVAQEKALTLPEPQLKYSPAHADSIRELRVKPQIHGYAHAECFSLWTCLIMLPGEKPSLRSQHCRRKISPFLNTEKAKRKVLGQLSRSVRRHLTHYPSTQSQDTDRQRSLAESVPDIILASC